MGRVLLRGSLSIMNRRIIKMGLALMAVGVVFIPVLIFSRTLNHRISSSPIQQVDNQDLIEVQNDPESVIDNERKEQNQNGQLKKIQEWLRKPPKFQNEKDHVWVANNKGQYQNRQDNQAQNINQFQQQWNGEYLVGNDQMDDDGNLWERDQAPYKDFPNITFYIRTGSDPGLLTCFYCLLWRTAVFFWPAAYGKMVLVLDEESERDHEFGGRFQQQVHQHFPEWTVNIHYEPFPEIGLDLNRLYRGAGYNRQLYNTFFVDLFTNDEIIAYMDTDVQLHIPFTKEHLFGKDQRRKLWVFGNPPVLFTDFEMYRSWAKSTEVALGFKPIGCFMATFPQMMYRDTITNTRNYILRRFNTDDFAYAYRQIYFDLKYFLSPINIIMNYAWYFERDRYAWHLNYPSKVVQDINNGLMERHRIHLDDLKPTVLGMDHVYKKEFIQDFFIRGYCETMRAVGQPVRWCGNTRHNSKDMCEMFSAVQGVRANWPDYTPFWCKDKNYLSCCEKSVQEHYRDVQHISISVHRFDIAKSKLVEHLAKEMGINCQPLQVP